MSKKLTGNKSQKIPIGEIEGSYLLVKFDWEIKPSKRIEDFHGSHEIDESEVWYKIQSILVYFKNSFTYELDIKKLESKQESAIEQVLSIYE